MRKYVCLKVTGFQILLAMSLAIGFTCIAQAQLIESASSSATAVQVAQPFEDGALIFVDRTHIYAFSEDKDPSLDADSRAFLESLVGSEYVMTSNSDKTVPNLQVTVTLAKGATIYLILDNRLGGAPGGLGIDPILPVQMQWVTDMGFVDTGYDVGIDESGDGSINQYSSIFTADFPAGDVVLGTQNDGGGRNNYSIIVAAAVKATNPSPANGATLVPLSPTLSWDAPSGVDNPTYDVYFGTDANAIQNPKIAAGISETSKAISGLSFDTTYYWRVDVLEPNDAGPNPTVHAGPIWQFTTTTQKPIFTVQPVQQAVFPGETATFSIEVENETGASFQWYRRDPNTMVETPLSDSDPDISGATSKTVTIVNAEIADEDDYFCRATNSAGPSDSAAVALVIKRVLLHYAFDGNTQDSSGSGNDGTLMNDPDPCYVNAVVEFNGTQLDLGKALWFDGTDDFVESNLKPADLGLAGSAPRTIESWVNTRVFNNGGIYDMGDYVDGQDFSLRTLGILNQWRVQYWGGGNDHDFTLPSRGQWIYFVQVFDGVTSSVYANGALVSRREPSNLDTANVNTFKVGVYHRIDADPVTTPGLFYAGSIADIVVYNYSKSDLEVAREWTDTFGGSICLSNPVNDFNGDCIVNLEDFALFAQAWMECNRVPTSACSN